MECFAKQNEGKLYLLDEYSANNSRSPHEISQGSNVKYLWNCRVCKSEFSLSPAARTSANQGCPYCASKKVNETNCLWTTDEDFENTYKLGRYAEEGKDVLDNPNFEKVNL